MNLEFLSVTNENFCDLLPDCSLCKNLTTAKLNFDFITSNIQSAIESGTVATYDYLEVVC